MKLHLTLKSCVDPESLNEALNPSSELLLLADPELMHNNTQDGYIYPAGIYLLKVNNRNTRTKVRIMLKVKDANGVVLVFTVNFEHISHLCSSVSIVNFEHAIAGWVM